MTKRKKNKELDQPNLKRFRLDVNTLIKNDQSPAFEHKLGKRKHQLSRKERRKEERALKKSRKLAFCQRKTLPTKESVQKEKKEVELKKKTEERQRRKKNAKKEKRRRLAKKNEEELEEKQRDLDIKNMYDDKEIRDLEKKLNLKKRKSKNLPQSFLADGLDYILDVVDAEKLQVLKEEDEENDPFGLEGDEEMDDVYDDDEEDVDFGEDDDGEDDNADGDDDDNADGDDDENGEDGAQDGSETESDMSDTEDMALSDKDDLENPKKEKWEELAEKIKAVVDKKQKTKQKLNSKGKEDNDRDFDEENILGNKSRKHVTFADSVVKGSDDDDEEGEEEGDWDDIEGEVVSDEDNDDEEDDFGEDSEDHESESSDVEPVLKEDIYGRLRDAEGNIVKDNKPAGGGGAYVPPAKRLQMAAHTDEKRRIEMDRLKKQLKGLVNRASESNIQPISSQIEGLYLNHSRADVNETMISLVWDACVSPVMTPERLAMELMMLVAILHGNVGSEVGAMFLQHLVSKLDSKLQEVQETENKEVDNMVQMLAHLYNFKVVHSVLIFDLLKKLVEAFTEKDIELILLVLRNVGFSLRKDNPNELKSLIVNIQNKAAAVDTSDQSRVKFMLDIILAIRNNNMRKIPNYDPEHLEHLRKLIRNYIRGGQFGDNQLMVTWEDLQNAEQKGKWWVVGSAWEGQGPKQLDKGSQPLPAGIEQGVSTRLQELARKQRMNTDLRRSIFYIIMTSEDYIDGFEKLLKIGVKSSQQNEIVTVILACCLQEQKFNPFYQYLAQRFCEHHRSFQMTFQFCLWDKFKEIERLKEWSVHNLGKLLTHLFVSKALSLSILKVITFGTLEKQMVRLLKQIFSDMLLEHPEQEVNAAFSRIATLEKLKPLHDGIKLFLHHFLVGKKKDSQTTKLAKRVASIDSLLTTKKSSMFL